MRIGTMFSGIGGIDLGAKRAGLELAWGIENNPAAAAVANRNLGDHVITSDAQTIDPHTLPPVDILHASPPCQSFSKTNQDSAEAELDIALASKVCDFINVLNPRIFTLENVREYRNSESWNIISSALARSGYWVKVENVNAADFGVPQHRHRMIVRAVRDAWVPYLPQPEQHVGWFEATRDLHSTLDKVGIPHHLALRVPTLDDILRENIKAFIVSGNHRKGQKKIFKLSHEPFFTITESQRVVHRICTLCAVLRSDVRCLLRFQSFPDGYTDTTLGIGNAVPPMMYEKIIRQLVDSVV